MMKNYRETDPEFMERFEHFAFDEALNEPGQGLEPVTAIWPFWPRCLAARE